MRGKFRVEIHILLFFFFFITQKRSSVFSYAFLELSEMIKELASFGPTETWVWILAVWPWPTSLCLIRIIKAYTLDWGFPGGNVVKIPPANVGDRKYPGLIPGSGRSPGEGNGNSSIFAWRIPWTRGGWRATVHRVTKNWDRTACTH